MTIKHLTDEQIRTWTREQKDRWWLTEVFRGDLPQLTWRSALVGFLLGGVLAATNLYIGAKTGIQVGVNLTSVILTFAFFRLLSRSGLARDFTILENNAHDVDRRLRALAALRSGWEELVGFCAYAVRRSGLPSLAGFASFRHFVLLPPPPRRPRGLAEGHRPRARRTRLVPLREALDRAAGVRAPGRG